MKKIILVVALFILPFLLAINIQVEKTSSGEVLISEIEQPASFDLEIKNNGATDNFQFYNLLGFSMAPKGTVRINSGETKLVNLLIYPRNDLNVKGAYTFEYYIRSSDGTETKNSIVMKIIELKDAFEIGSSQINTETSQLEIYIKNKVNFNFENLKVNFKSNFFNLDEEVSLEPFERKNISIQLNEEDLRKVIAGFYTMQAIVNLEDKKATIESTIKIPEKNKVITTQKSYGFIIKTDIIKKENLGNVVSQTETTIKKNIISRLFTTFSSDPDLVQRKGTTVFYTWIREVNPGQAFEINTKTNYLYPFIILILILVIVVLIKKFTSSDISIRKRVSFVRAKGGEFALKINVFVHANKYVERVVITDRLPMLVKLYHRFGGEEPDLVDEKSRRLQWKFEKLERGEIRTFSYLIYSKVGVVGKFALPETTAAYEKDGKIKETSSNKTFFVNETRNKELE